MAKRQNRIQEDGLAEVGPLILHRMSDDGMHVLDEGKVIVQDPEHLPVLDGPKFYKRRTAITTSLRRLEVWELSCVRVPPMGPANLV